MDPTAPKNNGQNPPSANPQTPIQPGQFVVAGDDALTAPQVATPIAPPPPPQPAVSLAGERQAGAEPQILASTPASGGSTQPDPTPFSQPVPGIPSADSAAQAVQSVGDPPKGGGSKKILVLLAVVVLLGIIAAVVYFFVLPQIQKKEETTATTDVLVEEPSPTPQVTDGGFGEIPESTTTASPSTTDLPPETAVDPLASPAQ